MISNRRRTLLSCLSFLQSIHWAVEGFAFCWNHHPLVVPIGERREGCTSKAQLLWMERRVQSAVDTYSVPVMETDSSAAGSGSSSSNINNGHRREFLSQLVTASVVSSIFMPSNSYASIAADDDVRPEKDSIAERSENAQRLSSSTNRFTSAQIQKFLQPIPTFAIVDRTGTPYMVVGEDAKLSAYFFTSFDEAQRILQIATESSTRSIQEAVREENAKRKMGGNVKPPLTSRAEIEDVIGINPWIGARISSVPLDFASGLAFKGKVRGAYFRIAPAEKDIEDAMALDNLDDLAEGKVPLFYFEDFEVGMKNGEELWSGVSAGNGASPTKIPLFFSKGQLLEEWKKQNPTRKRPEDVPPVKVTELFSLLTEMAKLQESENTGSENDLAKLVLVPPKNSKAQAEACRKRGGNEPPYKLGERIIVL